LSEQLLACFERAGDTRSVAQYAIGVGYGHFRLGSYAEAERAFRRMAADAETMGLSSVRALALENLGAVLAYQAKIAAARAAAEEDVLAEHRAQGNRRGENDARIYLAWIANRAGDPDRAVAAASAVLEDDEATPPHRARALGILADARRAQGGTSEALSAAQE